MRDCFLCGGKGDSCARVDSHDYLRCPDCGLVYVDSIEPADKLYSSYDGGFWKSLRRKLFMPFRSFTGARHFDRSMERANRIFNRVLSVGPKEVPNPTFLDIGCNKGFLLAAALSHGWDVHGIELIPELTLPFKRQYPRVANHVYASDFTGAQTTMKNEMFDAITAIDVIEHFEEPLRDMENIFRILKPGGVLLLQTPDTDNSMAVELKERWGALKPKEHLHLFNQKNLGLLARKLGFKGPEVFEAFDTEDGNFVAVLRK
jgi:SAM-dependent methyltransferase